MGKFGAEKRSDIVSCTVFTCFSQFDIVMRNFVWLTLAILACNAGTLDGASWKKKAHKFLMCRHMELQNIANLLSLIDLYAAVSAF